MKRDEWRGHLFDEVTTNRLRGQNRYVRPWCDPPAVITDGVHLGCADRKKLHRFAEKIGLKRCWFHRDHYDLTNEDVLKRALRAGALAAAGRHYVSMFPRRRDVSSR